MRAFLLLLALLGCTFRASCRPVELMEQEVGQRIFHQDPDYIIFVSVQATEPSEVFSQYCEQAKHGCAYMISSVDEFELFYKFMNIPQHSYYAIINAISRNKYVLNKPPTPENFKQFFDAYKKGTLEPHYASDPVPQEQAGPVKELVGLTIKEFVTQPGRNAAVFFYAEESVCEECVGLLEGYQKLAEKLSSPTFEFGRMNRVTNEHPSIEQQIVPAVVVYFPDGTTQVIQKFDMTELQYKLTRLTPGDSAPTSPANESAQL